MRTPDEMPLEEWEKPTPDSLPKRAERLERQEKAKRRRDKAAELRHNRDRKVRHIPAGRKPR